MAKQYVVTAPLVVTKDEAGADVYLYSGAPVPSIVPAAAVKALADLKMVTAVRSTTQASTTSGAQATGGVPNKSAAVGDWRAYAVSQGLTAEEAEALTKDQLQERFTAPVDGDGSGSDTGADDGQS